MELKVGMYARTKNGIGRVTECTKHESWGYIVKVLGQYSCYTHTSNGELSDVIKASDNLIDLIEVGDYVNDKRVYNISIVDGLKYLDVEVENYLSDMPFINADQIESIVTKEQFESMKYVVEK